MIHTITIVFSRKSIVPKMWAYCPSILYPIVAQIVQNIDNNNTLHMGGGGGGGLLQRWPGTVHLPIRKIVQC